MTSWDFYEKNAERLFSDYISLDFETIFSDVERYIGDCHGLALDVGSGSGRDAAALASKGFQVVAVEPSSRMRALAQDYYVGSDIYWVDDSLPLLSKIKSSNKKFDLILLSAVWMHLAEHEQAKSLEVLSSLLTDKGKLIITLRLGPAEPDRNISVVRTDELLELAKKNSLTPVFITELGTDSFKRNEIQWQKVVFSKSIV